MDNSENDTGEDETEWNNSYVDSFPLSANAASDASLDKTSGAITGERVILHFDLDCFYAQVEMLRNPSLRDVPLGIQQKYIIVTCNYVARGHGVTKLMSVTDAKEKCPQLVLVKGEDLTHYRDISYKLTELLVSFCPLVERLGFDENFMDITKMVERRLAETPASNRFSFKGHVYNHRSADVAKASDHPRLALGSHVAAELRDAIHSKLGLTGCAGVATSKLLAKLVSGTFKPNQQTTLLPENVGDIMGSLSGLRKVPGVGHQTAKRLQALGLVGVKDLQLFPLNDLVKEFGAPSARRLKNLALGVDDSPVAPTGAPQSLSDEDSFKKISTTREVLEKIQELLSSLMERMHKDGRQPQTLRLTLRRYSATNKWFSRESRQCPIPNHVGQKIASDSSEDAVVQLVPLAMKLFHKMVDCGAAFHLTLINVCFSNLQARGPAVGAKGSITSFFRQNLPPKGAEMFSPQSQEPSSRSGNTDHLFSAHRSLAQPTPPHETVTAEIPRGCGADLHGLKRKQRPVVASKKPPLVKESRSTAGSDPKVAVTHPNVDAEVFGLLPEEVRKELPSAADVSVSRVTENEFSQAFGDSQNQSASPTAVNHKAEASGAFPGENVTEAGRPPPPLPPDCEFPGDVDPGVFSELPADVQKELMSEWRRRKPVLKAPSSRKPGTSPTTKDRKAAGKGSQANNLLKYFKPS
ncbi:DNA polymerase iota isoform X1 [Gasterosteus aculeatus]